MVVAALSHMSRHSSGTGSVSGRGFRRYSRPAGGVAHRTGGVIGHTLVPWSRLSAHPFLLAVRQATRGLQEADTPFFSDRVWGFSMIVNTRRGGSPPRGFGRNTPKRPAGPVSYPEGIADDYRRLADEVLARLDGLPL